MRRFAYRFLLFFAGDYGAPTAGGSANRPPWRAGVWAPRPQTPGEAGMGGGKGRGVG
jgi:hypothetical protein